MTLREALSTISQSGDPITVLDYEVVLKENGEYGGYCVLPLNGVVVDTKNQTLILED